MKSFLVVLMLSWLAFAQGNVIATQHANPPMKGVNWAKGRAPIRTQATAPDLIYNGGLVMPSVVVQAIYWGKSWTSATYATDKISGLDSFYQGVGGSSYAATSDEYTDSTGQQVTTQISYVGHLIDSVKNFPRTIDSPAVLAEVCKVVPNPRADEYYPVYIAMGRGVHSFCAYHDTGVCNGVRVKYALLWNLDGDLSCSIHSTVPNQSQGLSDMASVSGHELSEARTDPNLDAWFTGSGFNFQENADKCIWTAGSPYVTFSNGTQWKIQGNWSNYAYDNNLGYPNSQGQNGCVDGANYPGPFTH